MSTAKRTAILISGRGSNMKSLIEAAKAPVYPAKIVGVFSNKADAPGLDYAREHGIPTATLSHRDYADRESFDHAVDEVLAGWDAELVCLAGFMRILSPGFVANWQGRMLNIHPSLLPKYAGLNTHSRALADGAEEHGCTVHFVTADLDAGPIIKQEVVPVMAGDTEELLAARVLEAEHRAYPRALERVASGAVKLAGDKVVVDFDVA